MGITKTDYTRGMQCPKMLWLDKHKPEKRIISQEMQAILDGGNEFGDKTMAMFGDYVETTTLKANGYVLFPDGCNVLSPLPQNPPYLRFPQGESISSYGLCFVFVSFFCEFRKFALEKVVVAVL